MASVNKVILLGRLGRDPESRTLPSGMQVCSFSLATSRKRKGQDGNTVEETEWHNVVVFGRPGEIAQQYLRKGSEAYVEGRLQTKKYTGKDGVEKTRTEIICEQLQLGARPQAGGGSAPASRPAASAPKAAPSWGGNSGSGNRAPWDDEAPF